MAVPAKSSGGCPEKPCAWSSSSQRSEATDPRRVASRGGFRRLRLLSQSQLAGAGGQVGLGHKVRLAQRLTGAQAAMDRLRVVPAGCRTPLPTPPEAASLLSFRSQLIHYPSEGSLISDAKQPSHHSQRAILVTALSVSAILLLVHCLSLPIRVKVPRGRGSALFFPG